MSEAFKILTANNIITKDIKTAINKALFVKAVLKPKTDVLVINLREFLIQKFLDSETYDSLIYGELRAEFGLDDEEVSNIYTMLNDIIHVYFNIYNTKVNNLVTLEVGLVDKEDIDFNTHGVFYTKKGEPIHWLYWLLTQDENEVVPDYALYLKQGAGRSEMAIMILPKDGSGGYRVEGYFAGTEKDNWITRTLRANKEEIVKIISQTLGS